MLHVLIIEYVLQIAFFALAFSFRPTLYFLFNYVPHEGNRPREAYRDFKEVEEGSEARVWSEVGAPPLASRNCGSA